MDIPVCHKSCQGFYAQPSPVLEPASGKTAALGQEAREPSFCLISPPITFIFRGKAVKDGGRAPLCFGRRRRSPPPVFLIVAKKRVNGRREGQIKPLPPGGDGRIRDGPHHPVPAVRKPLLPCRDMTLEYGGPPAGRYGLPHADPGEKGPTFGCPWEKTHHRRSRRGRRWECRRGKPDGRCPAGGADPHVLRQER